MSIEETNFFSVGEVSKKLGVSEQMIYKLIREQKLGAVAVGRHYKVTNEDITKYVELGRKRARERAARATRPSPSS